MKLCFPIPACDGPSVGLVPLPVSVLPGGLAQLARASALQAEGHRFDSDTLHKVWREPVPESGSFHHGCGLGPGDSQSWHLHCPSHRAYGRSSLTYWEKVVDRETEITVVVTLLQFQSSLKRTRAHGGCLGSERRRRTW